MFHLLYRVCRIAGMRRNSQYAQCVANHPLILWRIFHLVCLFLLPILRLRLDFVIHFSNKPVTILVTEYFQDPAIYGSIRLYKSKKEKFLT